jgi:hypothetical protein
MLASERRSDRWAPWWAYVIALVATNQLRTRLLVPDGMATWLQFVIGVVSMLAVATLVTVIYRAVKGSPGGVRR